MDFSQRWFLSLDAALRAQGLDSDAQSFDEILENLKMRKIYNSDEFAGHCAYVILAGGFSQKTAKKIHEKIMCLLRDVGADFDTLINVFNNKNKINAICKIWKTRDALCDGYYALGTLEDKLKFLQNLPHVGKITANHLARNLGENVVKYDIWIQRLGCAFAGKNLPIDNGNLSDDVKRACDDMFAHLVRETGLPRGYIDVVLWKSCQVKLISMDDYLHKPPVM
ncbi:MAG: hypothetical protein IJD52_01815 [Alphaproteobacteria bacterium]|nr:hypothetical protein [Alphaproteobacteria bacterium]